MCGIDPEIGANFFLTVILRIILFNSILVGKYLPSTLFLKKRDSFYIVILVAEVLLIFSNPLS